MHDDLRAIESGLDALEVAESASARTYRSRLFSIFAPLGALVVLIAMWQLVVSVRNIPQYILPTPLEVFNALREQWNHHVLQGAILRSISRALVGFVLAIIIATPIGLALGLNRVLRLIFAPILTGLQQLPSVAWVPAAIIWFGLSPKTIIAVILLGAVPSIANGLKAGIEQIPHIYRDAGKVMGATSVQSIRHIVLPAAWPGYLAGIEQGWAFAWRSLMAAELIAITPALGIGIGQLLDVGRQLGDMPLIIGVIFSILIIGICIERAIFSPLRTRTLRRRGL